MTRQLLLRQFSYVASSGYIAEALFVLRGLVAAYVLGPAAFGVWSTIRLVLLLSCYTDAGSISAMLQCSPEAEGAGSPKRAEAHRRVALATMLAGALLAAGGAALLFGGWMSDQEPRHTWWLVAVLVVAQQLLMFYEDVLASHRLFGWVAATDSSFAALSTVGCIVGALTLGLDGFLLGLVASYLVVILACPLVGPRFPRPAWRLRHAVRLMHVGWPIVLSQILLLLLWNIDKLMLWILRSNEQLGVYAIQSYFTVTVMLLPSAVAEVVLPHLRLRFGQTRSARAARPFLFEGTQLLAYVALPVIGLGFLLLHLPIRWLLPGYMDAIPPGRLLMLASFPSIVMTLSATVLIALSRHGGLIAIRAFSVAVSAGGAAAVLLSGGGLVELAAVMSLGFLIHAVLALALALRVVGCSLGEAVSWLAPIVTPYLGLALVLPMLLIWIPDHPADLMEDLILSAARCGILLLLLAPLAWRVWSNLKASPLDAQQMTEEI